MDCSPEKSFEIEKIAEKIAEKYYQNNPSQYYYTVNIMKILMQLFVHANDPKLSLHPYAAFLQAIKPNNPLYWSENVVKRTSFIEIFVSFSFVSRDLLAQPAKPAKKHALPDNLHEKRPRSFEYLRDFASAADTVYESNPKQKLELSPARPEEIYKGFHCDNVSGNRFGEPFILRKL